MQNKHGATARRAAGSWFLAGGLYLSFVAPAWPASVSQQTTGSCSPAVADVKGNVSVVCTGIDPAVLNDAIKLLNEILQDTKQIPKIREELERASKRADRLEAGQKSRKLTSKQQAELTEALNISPVKGNVKVVYVMGNGEANQFAKQMDHVLKEAGWPTSGISQALFTTPYPEGVSIVVRDPKNPPQHAQILRTVFLAFGIEVVGRYNSQLPAETVAIQVGIKPEPK